MHTTINRFYNITRVYRGFARSTLPGESAQQRHEWCFPLQNLQLTTILQSLDKCPFLIQLKHLPYLSNIHLRSLACVTFLHSSCLCPPRQKAQFVSFPAYIVVFRLSTRGLLAGRVFLFYSSLSSTSCARVSSNCSKSQA